jgi:hypothetical protein
MKLVSDARCNSVNADVSACGAAASESLLKFRAALDYQGSIYDGRKRFTNAIRAIFGDLNDASRIGVLPALAFIGLGVAAWYMMSALARRQRWLGMKPKKGDFKDVPDDVAMTIIRVLGASVITLICVCLCWTYGIYARYERLRADATLNHDVGGGGDGGLFHNSTFGKIVQACRTVSLRQIYNCSQGLPAVAEISEEEINNMIPANARTCSNGAPAALASDRDTLRIGLQTLVAADLTDFDAVAILKSIHQCISYLRAALSPRAATTHPLTTTELADIVDKLAAIMSEPSYAPRSDLVDDKDAAQIAFATATESMVDAVYPSFLASWPHLSPGLFMDQLDEKLAAYYDHGDKPGLAGFYHAYLRDNVASVLQAANDRARSALTNDNSRFASPEAFRRYNWPRIEAQKSRARGVTKALFLDICRYTKTFVRPTMNAPYEMSTVLIKYYVNCSIYIVTAVFVMFMVYYVCVYHKKTLKLVYAPPSSSSSTAAGERLLAGLDLVKYVLAGVALTSFFLNILASIKSKTLTRAEHNRNTTFYNSLALKKAAWDLLQAVNDLNCSSDYVTRYACDRTSLNVCEKGGREFQSRQQQQQLNGTKVALGKSLLLRGETLTGSDDTGLKSSLVSPNRRFELRMRSNGVLSIIDWIATPVVERWTSGSAPPSNAVVGDVVYKLTLRGTDGNLVISSSDKVTNTLINESIWSSKVDLKLSTYSNTTSVDVTDGGRMRLLGNGGTILWQTDCLVPYKEELSSLFSTSTSASLSSMQSESYRFYVAALNVINSYEKCNLITQNNKVPFPWAEFFIFAAFLLLAALAILYITNVANPQGRARELRDLLRLREKLSLVAGGSIPEDLRQEIKSRIDCGYTGPDIMRVLTFVFVVVVFIMNIVIIVQLNQSNQNYRSSLMALAADMCV